MVSFHVNAFEYVRKKVNPNYFVPQNDVSKKYKYAIPKYEEGVNYSENIGVHNKVQYRESYIPEVEYAETKNNNLGNGSLNPDYQNKYQEYLKDVDVIKEKGYVGDSEELKNDLSKMTSEQRIRIDKEFNKQRNIDKKIDNLIN